MSAAVTKPDAAILAAWGRRSVASAIYSGLPFTECPTEIYTPEEAEQVDIMDAAEEEICAATATTPRGVEVQLWTALAHIEQDRDDESAINIMDLDWFLMKEVDYDWSTRPILAALRSLRAMRAQGADTAAWDAALAEYEPIRQRWSQDYDESEALPTREERDAAYKAFTERLPGYQAARDKFMADPAPTIAALATKMEIADPVDEEHQELCKLDAQRLAGEAA